MTEEQGEWQTDTSDPYRTVSSRGLLTIIHIKPRPMYPYVFPKNERPSGGGIVCPRTGGGMRIAVLEALTGGRPATPSERANLFMLEERATGMLAGGVPIPLVENLIPAPSFIEEV